MHRQVISLFVVLSSFSLLYDANISLLHADKINSSIESMNVDPTTGTLTTPIGIDVVPGRAGIQPNIQLVYNSSSPNGIAGVGWILEFGRIERSLKHGVPLYNTPNTDSFILKQSGSTQELVDVGNNQYMPKTEGAFMKIVADPANNQWTVTDKKGVKYTFGGPGGYWLGPASGFDHTFSWLLERVEDLQGNYMYFNYQTANGECYLTNILYTGNTIQNLPTYAQINLNYQTRPDAIQNYFPGFVLNTTQRLQNIEVKVGNDLLRRYEFSYDNSSQSGRSRLVQVKHVGADGQSFLPVTNLTYSQGTSNFSGMTTANYSPQERLTQGSVRVLDMNGDGLPDILNTGTNPASNNDYYLYSNTAGNFTNAINIGSNTSGTLPDVRFIDLSGDGLMDIIYGNSGGTWFTYINNGNNGFGNYHVLSNEPPHSLSYPFPNNPSIIYFVDMNSDGLPDILETYSGNNQDYKIYFNQYNSTTNIVDFGAPVNATNSPVRGLDNVDVNMVDLNGDGNLDVLWSQAHNNWQVWVNNGHNGFLPSQSVTGHPDIVLSQQNWLNYVDLNGDGLIDLVSATGGPANNNYHRFINKGNLQFDYLGTASHSPSPGTDNLDIKFVDMNGDGLADIVDGSSTSGNWLIYYNNGRGDFDAPVSISNHPGLALSDPNVNIVDLNGDGKMDFLCSPSSSGSSYQFWIQSSEPATSHPDILTHIDNNQGTTLDLEYGNSLIKNLSGAGFRVSFSNVMFNTVKTSTTTIANPLNSAVPFSYTTSYNYMNGIWNFVEREFRGFGMVQVTSPDGNYVKTDYNQDDIKKGLISQQTSYTPSGNRITRTEYTWTPQLLAPGVNFIYLEKTNNYLYESNVKVKHTAEEYFYQEIPQYGNLTKNIQWGEVDSLGNDIGNDKKSIETDYLSNLTNYVIGVPNEVRVFDQNNNLMRKTWFYYDGHTSLTATPLSGLLTKKEEWNPTGTISGAPGSAGNPTTSYVYDNVGNLTQTINPLGQTSTVMYDTTYWLFPKQLLTR